MRPGFVKSQSIRRAIRSEHGDTLGYLAMKHGKQVFQSPDGRIVANILRLKSVPSSRTGAQGGAFTTPDWWQDTEGKKQP